MMEQPASASRLRTARNVILLHALEQVMSCAAKNGVKVLVLKGAALCSLGVYKLGERDFTDLDLLVSKEDLPRLKALLPGLGYEPIPGTANDYIMKGPDYDLCLPALDLHTEPFQFAPRYEEHRGLIWQSAAPLRSAQGLAPCPEWLLLIACLNPLLHSACLPFQASEDCGRIVAHYRLDWETAGATARKLGLAVLYNAALARLAQDIPGLIRPEPAGNRLTQKLSAMAAARRKPAPALQYLLPAALSPRMAWRRLLPEKEYFDAFGLPFTPFQRMKRALSLGAAFFKAIIGR